MDDQGTWRVARWAPAVTAVALAALVTAACGSGASSGMIGYSAPHSATATSTAPLKTAPKTVPYDLYTHCGIEYARVGNHYYKATTPLSDGSGNPPSGWGNPYQPGTLTLVTPTKAIFTDKAGHRVVFTLVPSGGHGRTTAYVCS